ncbi:MULTISPECIES: AMP-binding protein [unclassified Sporosarcina]|uniref:AMP-binding protein n=1 Tax=unclassified Sporosarcina TaxID=2647733 RepID=UPI00203F2941|nr:MULTISPECIES: AMP-binding protein [unclassified Sporosarcina]GKV65220.1 long-chain-fatty-acid--CoA ligase [Sporosarcina sp. NCCP-2331]GLB55344.1 long-chain-fatty-acid--CoA ligase [Sporosarcina sp. NCCP-2378]
MVLTLENKPLHEYLRKNASKHPEKVAIIYYGKKITYKDLDIYSDRLAQFLSLQGLRKGDSVGLYMQNCPQYIISHFAIQKIGGVVGPCNPMFKEWELEYELNDLNAKALITLDNQYPVFKNIKSKTQVENVIVTNYMDMLPEIPYPDFPETTIEKCTFAEVHDFMEIIVEDSQSVELPNINIDMSEDVGLVVYTSGTSGEPKGAMLTYKNTEFKTRCVIETYNYSDDDLVLGVMPIFHIAGMLVGMTSPIMAGATTVLLTRFDPMSVLQAMETYGVTVAYTTTPMIVEMIKQAGSSSEKPNLESLRLNLGTSFGIQVTKEISDEWEAVSGVPLFEFAYGMSETHTADTLMPPEAIKYGSFGKPTFETQIKIVNVEESGKVLGVGESGEIVIKSPSVFKGYMNSPEATSQSLIDGWFYSGDIGKIDADGYLYFLGRNKEMIKCSGYSVFPEEVEKMLNKHPKVNQTAVIGIPDSVRGESVKAFVVLNKGEEGSITEEELITWSKEKMAAYKYPREIEFMESLPQTSTNKILRRLLKSNK